MKNLLFFLWMLLAPIVEDCAEYIIYKTYGRSKTKEDEKGGAALFHLLVIIVVAYLLYEK